MSPKLWVVITGGILGIVAMRLVVGQLLALVQRYPALVDGAFVIIAWVGFKLCWEYLQPGRRASHFEIPQWFSLGLIAVIFTAAFVYAKLQGPVEVTPLGEVAEQALDAEAEALEVHDRSVHKYRGLGA